MTKKPLTKKTYAQRRVTADVLGEFESIGLNDCVAHFAPADYVDEAEALLEDGTSTRISDAVRRTIDAILTDMTLADWAAQVDLDGAKPTEEMMEAWQRGWYPCAIRQLGGNLARRKSERLYDTEMYYLLDADVNGDGEISERFMADIASLDAENYRRIDQGTFDDMLDLLARFSGMAAIAHGNAHVPVTPLFWAIPADSNVLYYADGDPDLEPHMQALAQRIIDGLGGAQAIDRRWHAQLDELGRRGYVWKSISGNKYEVRRKRPGDFPTPVVERKNPRRGAR